MSEGNLLKIGFVAFLDGLWWGLRENTGALSMYEGYEGGFKQMGSELAENMGGSGPERAAEIASSIFAAIGLEVEQEGKEIHVKSCPLWDRVLEKGLEFSLHIEKICWKPLLEGIGEKTGCNAVVDFSLRLAHIARSRIKHKTGKAKANLEKGAITQKEYESQVKVLEDDLKELPEIGRYRFK
ncbi:MAG: hypothetical protein RTU92_09410 [Candidatus Thorarchaeota archaeon]